MTELTVIAHPDCAVHDPQPGHPEQPARIRAVMEGLDQLDELRRLTASVADRGQLLRAHRGRYIDRLLELENDLGPDAPSMPLDPDTHVGHGSVRAARLAAGAACQAVDETTAGQRPTFAVIRPPGHHATADRAMGFCLLNSIAVAAEHALNTTNVRRVAICDFDVHHGNGTEEIVAGRREILFVSSHQLPLYPGSGDPGHGSAPNIHNVALPPGSGSDQFREAWKGKLLDRIERFGPDLILVSAGFDGHWRDPLAQLQLKDEDFFWIGHQLKVLADSHADGRLAASLEGGYDLRALTESALAFAEGITFTH